MIDHVARDRLSQVAMVVPLVAALLLLTVVPLVFAIGVSFTDLKLNRLTRWNWAALDQYRRLLGDERWWAAVLHSLVYIVVPTALQMLIGLALALLLHAAIHAVRWTRALFILPMVLPPVVVGVLWKAFLLPDLGGLDYFLSLVGLSAPRFLETAEGAMGALILTLTWEWTPFVMLLLLAGLESLPQDVFDAAHVDGANAWQQLRHVTLPMLWPTILVVLLFRIIESTKVFPVIFTITGGGPGNATENMDFYAYLTGFRYFDLGYSAALLVAILLVMAVICAPLYRALVRPQLAS
ncbi:MAG: sugar ABC transporter permease [Alphaproteobacteria bacterium]|nr:sugar ABC transporter permease [Alphaproteobacteria bacterium]